MSKSKRFADGTFFCCHNNIIHLGLRANALAVYVVLAKHADNTTGIAFPSIPLIADKTCLSENTVRRAIKELEQVGAIAKQERFKKRRGSDKAYQNSHEFVVMSELHLPAEMRCT